MYPNRHKELGNFTEVPQEDTIHEDDSADTESLLPQSRTVKPTRSIGGIVFLLLFFAIGVGLGSFLANQFGGRLTGLDRTCIRYVSKFSPVVKDIPVTFREVEFNGSMFHETIFRKDGSPEVDAAWQSLGVDYRAALIPQELGEASGLTSAHVQVNPKYGGGFPANVEAMHHLHCLNLLRKSLYFNFDYYLARGEGAFLNNATVLKYHVTHCLDTLRQLLMCNADVGVIGQVWWNKDEAHPFPEFNTRHVCRNFEAIRQWAEEHQAPDDVPPDYLQGPLRDSDVLAEIP